MAGTSRHAPPQAVIWDVDDTLVDTASSYLAGQQEALSRLGVQPTQVTRALAVWEYLLPFLGHAGRLGIFNAILIELGLPAPEDLAEIAASTRLSWHLGVTANIGAVECLSLLHERGDAIGIVSNGDPEPQKIKLVQSGLAAFFTDQHMVFTPSGTPTAKPSPAGLLACANALHVPPQRCWYVGNHTTDVIAANLAGMTPILIAPGKVTTRFTIERPARAVGDLCDLYQWLAHVCSDSPDVSRTRTTSVPIHT